MWLSLIFLACAAMCNAVMDTCEHHYYKSIFKPYNREYWDGTMSWLNKYKANNVKYGRRKLIYNINYPVQLTDAWHLFKMLMIIFIVLSIVTFSSNITMTWYTYTIVILIFGITWNSIFSIFYNRILIKCGLV